MRRTFSSNSYWLQLLNDGIPSKRHRSPNKLLRFGETSLTETFSSGKKGILTKVWSNRCEVEKKYYRLEKGINQADPPLTENLP